MKKIFFIIMFFVLCLSNINAQEQKNNIQFLIGYQTDIYSKPYYRDFNLLSTGFGYKSNLTALYGKINLAYLYVDVNNVLTKTINKTQFEIDWWQSLSNSKSTSFWLNYAYSQHTLFPNHRVMFEMWQKLPAKFLISGGGNYYMFSEKDVIILNIGLENYFDRYWVEFKTYFYLKEPKITTSYYLSGRVFFKDVNYLQLTVGMGSAEDEPFILESNMDRLYAYTTRVRYVNKTLFNERIEILTGFTYMYEEYLLDEWRNRFGFGIGLIYNIRK